MVEGEAAVFNFPFRHTVAGVTSGDRLTLAGIP